MSVPSHEVVYLNLQARDVYDAVDIAEYILKFQPKELPIWISHSQEQRLKKVFAEFKRLYNQD